MANKEVEKHQGIYEAHHDTSIDNHLTINEPNIPSKEGASGIDWENAPRTRLEEQGPDSHWTPHTTERRLTLGEVSFIDHSQSKGIDRAEEDIIEDYFTRAAQYPLLTKDLEQLIFQARKEGIGIAELAQHELFYEFFDEEDRDKAVQLIADSKSIDELLYLTNMKLVEHNIDRFKGRMPHTDLLQAGGLGLLRAIKTYDHTRGFKFSTYASRFIEGQAQDALTKEGTTIYIPSHVLKDLGTLRVYVNAYWQEYNSEPTISEAKQYLRNNGIKESTIDLLFSNLDSKAFTPPASLDKPIESGDGTTTLSEFVENTSAGSRPDALVETILLQETARTELQRILTPREFELIEIRYGLKNDQTLNFRQVGKIMGGISKARAQQIEAKAFNKIAAYAPHLRSLLPENFTNTE